MTQLAIKGHPTRGKEVIQLLEMLGGVNCYNLYGNTNFSYYTIENNEIKGGIYIFGDEPYKFFTLEEFEEKYPYKVGDKVTIKEGDGKYYIRIGEIPQNETSSIYRGDNIIGKENGVSVYNCVEINNKYHIVMPIPLKEGQGSTYEIFIQSITQCRFKIDNPSKVYLVTGDEVGVGNDNEPTLKNIKIIKDITSDFINT